MSTKRILLSSSLLNGLGHFILLVASFFSLPILIGALGTATFGQYILLIGIPAIAGLFDLGFGNGSLYYLSQNPSPTQWQKTLASNLVATLPMVVAAALVAYIGVGRELFVSMAILVLVNQLSDIMLMLAQSHNNYAIFNFKVIVVGLGNTLVSAYVATQTHSLVSVIAVQILFQLVVAGCIAMWVRRLGYPITPTWDKEYAKKTFRYGLSTFGSTLAGQLQAQTARYYLSYIFSTSATAIYGLAQSLVQKGLTLIQVTGRSFFAVSANLHGRQRGDTIRRLFATSLTGILVIGLAAVVGTHYLGLPILEWWLGDKLLASQVYPVLVILSYWFLSVSLTPLTSYIGLGIGQGKLVSAFALSSAIVEIALMVLLTPRLGLTGPALAALISSYLHTPPFLYILWRRLRVNS